jgi:hypothetical protein
VEALRAKFAKASGAKAASKEEGVSWSTPEEEMYLMGGTKQGINPEADAAGVVHTNVGQNFTLHNPSLGLFLYHFVHTMVS